MAVLGPAPGSDGAGYRTHRTRFNASAAHWNATGNATLVNASTCPAPLEEVLCAEATRTVLANNYSIQCDDIWVRLLPATNSRRSPCPACT